VTGRFGVLLFGLLLLVLLIAGAFAVGYLAGRLVV
jgi:hypothetical protein